MPYIKYSVIWIHFVISTNSFYVAQIRKLTYWFQHTQKGSWIDYKHSVKRYIKINDILYYSFLHLIFLGKNINNNEAKSQNNKSETKSQINNSETKATANLLRDINLF